MDRVSPVFSLLRNFSKHLSVKNITIYQLTVYYHFYYPHTGFYNTQTHTHIWRGHIGPIQTYWNHLVIHITNIQTDDITARPEPSPKYTMSKLNWNIIIHMKNIHKTLSNARLLCIDIHNSSLFYLVCYLHTTYMHTLRSPPGARLCTYT